MIQGPCYIVSLVLLQAAFPVQARAQQVAVPDPSQNPHPTQQDRSSAAIERRSPILAGGLSLVLPGAGQMYNGQTVVGGIVMAAQICCYLAAFAYARALSPGESFELSPESTVMFVVAGAIHVFSIYDAITEAQRINDNLDRFAMMYNPWDNSFAIAYRFTW